MADALKPAEIAICIPIFNKFAYARRAILSFQKYSELPLRFYAIDDASPFYPDQNWETWRDGIPEDRLVFKHFGENRGLTRAWNLACTWAKEQEIKYTVCTNSDVLATPGWDEPLIHHLERGYDLVAPVTNAPGVTNNGHQRVSNYFPSYQISDDPTYNNQVAAALKQKFPINIIQGSMPVNGFFMMARTDTWWGGAFDTEHVFNPANKMTKNEDELQGRWLKKGRKIGFVPSSFIFHYRAVSRGDAYKHRGWFRIEDINKPV